MHFIIPTYHLWLLIYFVTPILLLEVFAYKHLRPYHRVYLLVAVGCIVIGSLWDIFAVWAGIWWWPAVCCVLPRIDSIPLEELLFMAMGGIYIAQLTIIVGDILKIHRAGRKRSTL